MCGGCVGNKKKMFFPLKISIPNNSFEQQFRNVSFYRNIPFRWYVFKSNINEILYTSILNMLKFDSNKKKKHGGELKINENIPPIKLVNYSCSK